MMITKVSLGLSILIMERFRGCDRFYAVRQFYAKAIFVMDGLLGWQGGDTFPFCDWMTLFLWNGRVTHWRYHIQAISDSSHRHPRKLSAEPQSRRLYKDTIPAVLLRHQRESKSIRLADTANYADFEYLRRSGTFPKEDL